MMKKLLCMVIIVMVAVIPFATVGVFAETFNMGDVDLSGKVTVKDATLVQKFIADKADFSEFQVILSDVDRNDRINVKDCTMIQKYLAGITKDEVFGIGIDDGYSFGEKPQENTLATQDVTSDTESVPAETAEASKPVSKPVVTEPYTEAEKPSESTPEVTDVPETEPATEVVTVPETEVITVPVTIPVIEEAEETEDLFTLDGIEKAVAKKFLEYVNEERASVGVQPLEMNPTLNKAAKVRSGEIIDCWSHQRPDGSSCFTAVENMWSFGQLGENIAMNGGICHFSEESIQEDIDYAARFFFGQFKSSPGHYQNMIRENFCVTGIGVEIDAPFCYMAHMFGSVNA